MPPTSSVSDIVASKVCCVPPTGSVSDIVASKVCCVPPTGSVSDIVDLIRSLWASYQPEDVAEDMYCEDVDPKKSKHCQLLTFQ